MRPAIISRNILFALFLIIFSGGLIFNLSGCGKGLQNKPTPIPTSPSPTPTPITYSISGKVLFASTTDGIRDGVTIAVSGESATYVATTEIDTGTFEVTGLGSGKYKIFGYKDGWTISNMSTTIDASSLTSQNITAEPNYWTVSYIGGSNADIIFVGSEDNQMVALGSGFGAPFYTSVNSGETWTEHLQSEITSESISLIIAHWNGEGSMEAIDSSGGCWVRNIGETWYFDGRFTVEAGVAPQSHDDLYDDVVVVIGNNGKFYYSINEKEDVYVRCDTAGLNLNSLVTFNNEVLVVGDSGFINYLADGSTTPEVSSRWSSRSLASSNTDVIGVECADDDNESLHARLVIVSTSRGAIYYTYPKNLSTWTTWLSGVPYSLNAMTDIDKSTSLGDLSGMMVFGDNGLILKRN